MGLKWKSQKHDSDMTFRTNQKQNIQLSRTQRDNWRIRKDKKCCKTKQRPNTKPHKQWEQLQLINIYIHNVHALNETIIPSCFHFLMQNIEQSRGLGCVSRWSYANASQ